MTELELYEARGATRRERRWSDHQQDVLELIAQRAPLPRALGAILRAAESHAPGMLGSILLIERARGGRPMLTHAAAPSLPRAYTSLCVGLEIAEGSGLCGTAAFRREPVVVEDFAADPLTAAIAPLAAEHGLRAGFSTPILSSAGGLLGAFAMYFSAARRPDAREQTVVERSIHLARLAIEQADDARTLRRNATRAQTLAREQTAAGRATRSACCRRASS